MTYWPYVLMAALALALFVALLVGRSRRSLTPDIPVTAVGAKDLVPAGTIDLDALLTTIEWPGAQGNEPVLVDLQDGTALVLGSTAQAQSYGEVIGNAGPKLVSGARRLSTAMQAGIQAGEQAGHLVRLHPESVKALQVLKPDQAKDAAGFILGTLRGSDGKYRHVVRLKDVGKLQTISSGAAILSALAMQAQLDRIEKQLGQIQSGVAGIQRTMDDKGRADRLALDHLFGEIYRTAHATGQLTPAQWQQVAPHISATYSLREQTLQALQHLVRDIEGLPTKAKDRRQQLGSMNPRLRDLVLQLDGDDRRVGQAQALRLWHLTTAGDPSLPATLQDTRAQVDARLQGRAAVLAQIEAAVQDTDVGGFQSIHTRHRASIRESGFALSYEAREHLNALPSRLAIGSAEKLSPEDVALSYTLTSDEALVLTVAQCWLMSQCAEDEPGMADVQRFVKAALATMAATDRSVLGPASVELINRVLAQPPAAQLATLSDLRTLERVAKEGDQSRVRSLLLLIELYSFHPWTPKDPDRPLKTARKWNQSKRSTGIQRIANVLAGTGESDAKTVGKSTEETLETLFQGSVLVPVALMLVGGIGAGVLTSGLAAPAIGAAVGTSMFGLYGAAATSAGLAALGGGSLAAGGLGMAGGTAVISAAGGLLGLGFGAGAATGVQASSDAQARVLGRMVSDTVKLHVLCKVVLIEELGDLAGLDVVIAGLRHRRDELAEIITVREKPVRPSAEAASVGGLTTGSQEQVKAERDAFREESDRLKALEQALERAVKDLLKRRIALVRSLGVSDG